MQNNKTLRIIYGGRLDITTGIPRVIFYLLKGLGDLIDRPRRIILETYGVDPLFLTELSSYYEDLLHIKPNVLKLFPKRKSSNLIEIGKGLVFIYSTKSRDLNTINHVFGASSLWGDIATAQDCFYAWLLTARKYGLMKAIKWPYYKSISTYEKNIYNNVRYIVVPSDQVKLELSQYYGIKRDKITVIPNPIPIDYFNCISKQQIRSKIRSKLGANEDEFILLFVGNYAERKGFKFLLQSFIYLPRELRKRIRLLVIGDVRPPNQIAFERILNKVNFLGRINKLKPYYFAADVLVFPSLYEGFGMPICEALLCGLPVIASKTGIAPQVIKHGENGLLLDCVRGNLIAESIRYVISHGPYPSYKPLLHYEWFDPSNVASEYNAIYQQI
jgi:glycosyltransferase involved in cell wall biosynthesis